MEENQRKLFLRQKLSVNKTLYELYRAICAGFCVAIIVKQLFASLDVIEGANIAVAIFIIVFGVLSLLFGLRVAKYEHILGL